MITWFFHSRRFFYTYSFLYFVTHVLKFVVNIIGVCSFVFGISLANIESHRGSTKNILMFINLIALLILIVTLLMLGRLPKAEEDLSFKVWPHLITRTQHCNFFQLNVTNIYDRIIIKHPFIWLKTGIYSKTKNGCSYFIVNVLRYLWFPLYRV